MRKSAKKTYIRPRYLPRYNWFIVLDCFRRLSQTGLLIFVHPGSLSQIIVGIFFSLLSLAALARFAPYIEPTNDTLAFAGQFQRAPASDAFHQRTSRGGI